jgi:eukaryotic-like serine/threonine-protein kinase
MNGDRAFPSLESIVVQALAKSDPAERALYLDRVCGEDADLRQDVDRILQARDQAVRKAEAARAGVGSDATAETPAGPQARGPSDRPSRPSHETVGSRIGPYKLLQEIGQGGMGAVYMAEQEKPVRRRVALKIIKQGMDTRQVVARFEAERQALALMDHPNIAKVLDAGTTDSGRPYFVMDLVKGIPITEYCDEAKLSPRERLELFILVCRAIQHAHQKGIIHRDIKPSNVMVTLHDGEPVPRVIDFGVAKAIDQRLTERTMFTQYGEVVGTLEYMSPEQAEMSGLDVDTRSDIYSLGVLLYELLTGTTPLERAKLRQAGYGEILRRIKEEDPPKPSTRLKDSGGRLAVLSALRRTEPARLTRMMRGDLDWIVMKALEKDRTRRYETASALARDIERYLAGDPVEAGPPSAAYRLRRLMGKHRGALATAAAVALVLIAASVVSTWEAIRATRAERRAADQAKRALLAETQARSERDRARRAEAEAVAERNAAVASKKQADEQAAITKAVNDFLQNDLLAEAAPDKNPRNKKVTVEELLGRAAVKIAGKFENRPELEAAIRLTIGRALTSLGLYAEARQHLEAAVEIDRRVLGPEHRDTIVALYNLAELQIKQGKYSAAEALLRPTLDVAKRVLGAEHPDTLETASTLAAAIFYQGKYTEAGGLFRQVLSAAPRVFGVDSSETLDIQQDLAVNFADEGKNAEAESLLRKTLESKQRVSGREHPVTLITQRNLAHVYVKEFKFADAEPLLCQTIEAMSRVFGPDHRETLLAEHELALLHFYQGKFVEAEPLFVKSLETYRRVRGPEHPETLAAQHDLARLLFAQGRLPEAESLYAKTLEADRRVRGPEHPRTLVTQNQLGWLYFSQGRLAEAENLFAKSLEANRRTRGLDHPETLESQRLLARAVFEQGKFTQAEDLFRQTLALERKGLAADDPALALTLAALGSTLVKLDRPSDAEPLLREALSIQRRTIPDQWHTFQTQSRLGASLLGQKKYAEAEPLLLQAYDGMQAREAEIPPMYKKRLAEAGERILQLYADWSKPDKAAEWETRLRRPKGALPASRD